jgi:hypothetical protein
MLQTLGPILPPYGSCTDSVNDVVMWITYSMCHMCPPELVNGSFRSIDHYILYWLCGWLRCWMLKDMDHMEAISVFYVKVGRFDPLEQDKICDLTITSFRILMLTIHYNLMVSVWFMEDTRNDIRQTSPDVLSIQECPYYIYETWNFSCCLLYCVPVNKQTTLDCLSANHRTIRIPCDH